MRIRVAQTVLRDAPLSDLEACADIEPDLVWVFGDVQALTSDRLWSALDQALPGVPRVGCSTAGEITAAGVAEGTVVVTAMRVGGGVAVATTDFKGQDDSYESGFRLGRELANPRLHSVITFAQGVDINGSAFIDGLSGVMGIGVQISGGLAADVENRKVAPSQDGPFPS